MQSIFPFQSVRFLDALSSSHLSLEYFGLAGLYAEATRSFVPPKEPPTLLSNFSNIKTVSFEQASATAIAIPMAMYQNRKHSFFPKHRIDCFHYGKALEIQSVRAHPVTNLMQLLRALESPKVTFGDLLIDRLPTLNEVASD